MDARCDLYDLPPEMCGHCTGAEERARAEEQPEVRQARGNWFEARYPGVCSGCGDPIEPGDVIRADGRGGYVCGYPCS